MVPAVAAASAMIGAAAGTPWAGSSGMMSSQLLACRTVRNCGSRAVGPPNAHGSPRNPRRAAPFYAAQARQRWTSYTQNYTDVIFFRRHAVDLW